MVKLHKHGVPNPVYVMNGEFDFPLGVAPVTLRAAMGLHPGVSTVNKFGRNIEVDSGVVADIWDGGHTVASGGVSLIWVAPTIARTHTIASTDAGDTSDGAGARTMRISGLIDWDIPEVSEDVTLNTGSPPVTARSYVIIHRMQVLTMGATSVNIGTITATATGDGTVTAQLRPGEGQTQMAIYGIPSVQTAYMGRIYANVNRSVVASSAVDISLRVNPEPDAQLTNYLAKHTFGLQTDGTSAFTILYYVPKVIPGPAIIKIQATSGANDMDISAGFDLLLVNNE
jgi:hypothetical protein